MSVIPRGDKQQVLHEVVEVVPGEQQPGLLQGGQTCRACHRLHRRARTETQPGGCSGEAPVEDSQAHWRPLVWRPPHGQEGGRETQREPQQIFGEQQGEEEETVAGEGAAEEGPHQESGRLHRLDVPARPRAGADLYLSPVQGRQLTLTEWPQL